MNRELKFKIWNFLDKEWIGSVLDSTTLHVNDWFRRKNSIFLQYTGLKDKNGVEIYEGDIVQQRHFDDWLDTEGFIFKGEVEFVYIKDDFDSYTAAWRLGRFFNLKSDCEVIGNIYENPELLES